MIFLDEAIRRGSSDPLVCKAAEQNDAILVACDRDMRQLAKRNGIAQGRFKKLSLLLIENPPTAVPRLKEAMSPIEHEWKVSQRKQARRMHVSVSKSVIRTHR